MPTPTSDTPLPHQPTAVFGSAYLGNVRYYAAMLADGCVAIDTAQRVGRSSWMHNHCRIVGANGVQSLAIPVEHITTAGKIVMRDLRISEHGDWRRVHWGAIFSAYGKAPFFEYIEDDLRAIYERNDKWLIDLNMALHNLLVDFLDLPITTVPSPSFPAGASDWRDKIGGKKPDNIESIVDVPYYNVWQERHGHIPALSIIDLLMNCGRESIFTLKKMAENLT